MICVLPTIARAIDVSDVASRLLLAGYDPQILVTMSHSVADLCREQGITVEDLAQRAGLEVSRVTAIALGRWTPSPAERQKIAGVFGVAINEITWGHATPIQHLYGHGPG